MLTVFPKVHVLAVALFLLAGITGCQTQQASVAQHTREPISNPVSGISCADPSLVKHDGRYYIYATIDPWGGDELVVLESSNFKNWERKHIQWPNPNDCASPSSGKDKVWAPAVIKGKDGISPSILPLWGPAIILCSQKTARTIYCITKSGITADHCSVN